MPVSNTNKPNLLDTKAELMELVRQRKALTESLSTLERQIYLFEGSYLEDTAQYGNIIKGWDRYLSASASSKPADARGDKRARKIKDSERLFSRSSVTGMTAMQNHGDVYDKGEGGLAADHTLSQMELDGESHLPNGHPEPSGHRGAASSNLDQSLSSSDRGNANSLSNSSAKKKHMRKHNKTR